MVTLASRVGYITDVEGNLDYFHNYVKISKVLKWKDDDKKDALDFQNSNDHFVFGGDSQVSPIVCVGR